MGLLYLPILIPYTSTIHVGKYTSPMDPMGWTGVIISISRVISYNPTYPVVFGHLQGPHGAPSITGIWPTYRMILRTPILKFPKTSPKSTDSVVRVNGGSQHIFTQLSVYTAYIPGIYCLLGGYRIHTTYYQNQNNRMICMGVNWGY